MNCKKCNKNIPDDSSFCPYCGKKAPFAEIERKKRTRGNGEGTVWQDSRTKKWTAQVTWWDWEGKRHYRTKKGLSSKKAALEARDELKKLDALPERGQTVWDIWQAMSPAWLDGLSEGKAKHYQLAFDRMKKLYRAEIQNLITQDWQDVIDEIPGKHDPKKEAKVVASKIYQYAMAQGWVSINMAQFVRLPGQKESTRDAFTGKEIASFWALWEREKSGFVAYILILCYTGMRPGELHSVALEDVHVDELYMVGGIKSAAGKGRCIAFPEFLRPLVEYAVEESKRKRRKTLYRDRDNAFYADYYATLDVCGIQRTDKRRMEPHCCRHTFTTMMTRTGTALTTVQKMVGHADVKTTASYTHAHDPELIEAVQALAKPPVSHSGN